jgi:hypothetical protein
VTLTLCCTDSGLLSILAHSLNIFNLTQAQTHFTPTQFQQGKNSRDLVYGVLPVVDVNLLNLEPGQDQLSAASTSTCLRLMGRART